MPRIRTAREVEFLEYFRRIDKRPIMEILSEFREVITWWRNLDPDRDAKLVEQVARMDEGVAVLLETSAQTLESLERVRAEIGDLKRQVKEIPEKIEAVIGLFVFSQDAFDGAVGDASRVKGMGP